jgi:hypothetical protein
MEITPFSKAAAANALDRLIEIARSDTGQARRVANFLLAWWNGDDCGHFPIADLFGLDMTIGTHIATIIGFWPSTKARFTLTLSLAGKR